MRKDGCKQWVREGCWDVAALRSNSGDGRTPQRRQGSDSAKEPTLERVELAVREQFRLLDTYAPSWFSQAQHERTVAALREGGESLRVVFSELCELLEQYGPGWFSEDHHKEADSVRKLLKECAESSGRKPKRRGKGAGG